MEKFNLDIVSRTLTITAKFAEKMNNTESDEYQLVLRYQHDLPGLRIVKRTHKTPTSYNNKNGSKTKCNQFKNLTYERMEKFIKALPENTEYLREFQTVKDTASIMLSNGYPLVRKWFEKQFPQYCKNPLFYLDNAPDLVKASEVIQEAEKEAASANEAA